MTIGKQIKEARIAKGWTQTELAEQCGLSLRTIQRLENDENAASLYTSGKIWEALGIKIQELSEDRENLSIHSKFLKRMQVFTGSLPSWVLGSLTLGLTLLGLDFFQKNATPNPNDLIKGVIETATINCGSDSECDIQVTLKDEQGEILWQKTFGGSSYDKASKAIASPDGGFLILGSTSSYGQGNYDILLIKVNEQGEFLWQKTYGGFFNEYASSISFLENGSGILVEGSQQKCSTPNVSENCSMEAWKFKLTPEGEFIG